MAEFACPGCGQQIQNGDGMCHRCGETIATPTPAQWTSSDGAGFALALAILNLPPIIFTWCAHQTLRKPCQPPEPVEEYLEIALLGSIGAMLSSAIAWRFGGGATGRWAMHGLVATIVLMTFSIGWCCVWPRP